MMSVQRFHQFYLCFTLFVFHHQFFSACFPLPWLVLISVSFMCCSCCCDDVLQVSLLSWWDTDDFSSPACTLCRRTPCLTGQDSSACWSASVSRGFVLFALSRKVCLLFAHCNSPFLSFEIIFTWNFKNFQLSFTWLIYIFSTCQKIWAFYFFIWMFSLPQISTMRIILNNLKWFFDLDLKFRKF